MKLCQVLLAVHFMGRSLGCTPLDFALVAVEPEMEVKYSDAGCLNPA